MLQVAHVDAFVAEGVRGNPAAVVLVPTSSWQTSCNAAWMQKIAAQFGLSETAFVSRVAETAGTFRLKWFTPTKEVSLCGHATLATAHALLQWAKWRPAKADDELSALVAHVEGRSTVHFETLSGTLTVSFNTTSAAGGTGIAGGDELLMRFPYNAPSAPRNEAAVALYQTIAGVTFDAAGADKAAAAVQEFAFNATTGKLIIRLADDGGYSRIADMRAPDPSALLAIDQSTVPKEDRVTGVSVTAASPVAPYAFCSRYFSPWNGIPEDPVNGSSHTILAPYWADRLGLWREVAGDSKEVREAEMTAVQLSAKPAGGVLKLKARAAPSPSSSWVEIGGLASTVYTGTIVSP